MWLTWSDKLYQLNLLSIMRSDLFVQFDSEYLILINLINLISSNQSISSNQLNISKVIWSTLHISSTLLDQVDLIHLLWSTWSRLQPIVALSKSTLLKQSFQIQCLTGMLAWAWLSSSAQPQLVHINVNTNVPMNVHINVYILNIFLKVQVNVFMDIHLPL